MDVLLLLLSHFNHVRLCATPETAAHQAPPSLGFSRQEHWSGVPFPSPMQESENWKWKHSVVSDSSRSRRLQPTRLLCPWDMPGKNTGMGCHCLLLWMWELDYKESSVLKYWCFWTVVLEKILESPLDYKEIHISPSERRSILGVHWKDWCWSWNSNNLANWCKELTRLKRPWCWERLKGGGEGDNTGWDG